MNRRKLLLGSGVALSTVLAGCSSDETSDESGNGDGNGSGNGNGDGGEQEQLVEVLEHEYTRGGTFPSVTGQIENVSGEEVSSVNVNIDFLDEEDVLIGEGLANTFDLPAGRVWEFEASYTGDESYRIDDYELEIDARP